ncbi:MAG: hypothetical protein K9H25_17325 [Rhodospirillum sp.]|nr:hypothetical protein [Rhodospirillum sp.]MCF8502885.1 hypothetical protein [Rhodospirillum sp.]
MIKKGRPPLNTEAMTDAERAARARAKKRVEAEQMAREAAAGRALTAHLRRLRTASDRGDMVLIGKIVATMEAAAEGLNP